MKRFSLKDVTSGFTKNVTTEDLLSMNDDIDHNHNSLHRFAMIAVKGNQWTSEESVIICISSNIEHEKSGLKNETANGAKPVLYDVGAKRKYYYIEEITSCVICGREKRYRQRVYEKPEPHLRVNWKEDACSTHFI